MKNISRHFKNNAATPVLRAMTIAAALLTASAPVQAYDLQPGTIYASAPGGIYKVDVDTASAAKVADSTASLSAIQDVTFDGTTLYGMNLHWQLLKLEPEQTTTVAINKASSFSLQFRGVAARDGVLYGAELRSLVTVDKQTGNTGSPGPAASSYGLGAGEIITDLAFAENGSLYATVNFPGLPFTFLGTVNPATGALTPVGTTGIENINALAVKDGKLYAMDILGSLYSLDRVSGFATKIADGVLGGVTGMGTSPAAIMASGEAAPAGNANQGDAAGAGGGLSVLWSLLTLPMLWLRRYPRT